MKVLVLVVAFLAVYCSAQLTTTDKNTILSLHNNARASASPTPQTPLQPLVWDNTIAADAQTWVGKCTQNYSPKYYGNVYGENPVILSFLDIPTAFNFWFQQSASWNFAAASCSTSTCMNYQQIVSSTATSIGCGVATCSFGTFFVCNYKSYAQYGGVNPYTPAGGSATNAPTSKPTAGPTTKPTNPPTGGATVKPTSPATVKPTAGATVKPTAGPTTKPSGYASIDYRGTAAVVGVHDQKQCGSCWAFSSTAIIEGALGKRGIIVPMLSDQNVLDCSNGGSCDGGWTVTALKGMITKGGINTNAAYPYKAAQGTCAYNAATSQGAITKTGQTKGDFAAIYAALNAYGPVGIAVYADNSWYSYKSGVIAADYTSVNHAVTVVGYNQTLDAWIVKNSWGGSWGMSGYCYISATRPAGAQQNGAFWAQ